MKQFLKKILIFSVIVTTIFTAYEMALLKVPNEYSYKKNYLEEHKDSLRVLVLGNSHLADCIDCSMLGKWAFNAAQPGRSFYYDLQLLKEYIGQMPNLQCVVLPFSYDYQYWGHLFEKKHEAKFNTYRCMYIKYMGYPYSDGEWWHWSEILNSNFDHSGRLVDALLLVQHGPLHNRPLLSPSPFDIVNISALQRNHASLGDTGADGSRVGICPLERERPALVGLHGIDAAARPAHPALELVQFHLFASFAFFAAKH